MYQYARPNITPRSGYAYTDPDTGVKFDEPVHRTLVSSVARHRRANKIPVPPDLSEIIEDAICKINPPSFRKPRPVPGPLSPSFPPGTTRSGLPPVSRATATNNTLKILKKRSHPLADIAEVVRRARICLACGFNKAEPCCYSCFVEDIFNGVIGRHKKLQTQFVGLCAADMTFSKAVINVNFEFDPSLYPEMCWKRGEKDVQDPDSVEH